MYSQQLSDVTGAGLRRICRFHSVALPLVCGALFLALGSEGAVISRGPYLQRASSSNIVVRWRTDTATSSRVRYGTNIANLNLTRDVTTSVVDHEIVVSGLSNDTRYYYTVGSTSAVLTPTNTSQYFLTHPLPGASKPMRVWVIGDAGTGTANQLAVRNAFYTYNGSRDVNVWLQLGDNAYSSGTDAQYQTNVFNVYSNQLRRTVTWPTLGNHDTAQSTAFVNTYPYFSIFTLPAAGECGGVASGTEHYYSFDHGMVHFICLDSMTASRAKNGAMATWLQSDLATTTNDWIIAYWHHPPYTKGSHDSDTEIELVEMRENIVPILEAGGVDLVLAGHSHVYERSLLISGHYGLSSTFASSNIVQAGSGRGTGAYVKSTEGSTAGYGTVYAVAGSSGQASGGTLDHPAMYISLNNLGSMVLDITSNRLDAVFLRETGATNDWFTLRKNFALPNHVPIAANDSTTTLEETPITISVLANDTDADGDRLAIQSVTQGTNGTVSITGTNVIYRPATNWNGLDAFTYVASDGQGGSATGRVSVTVLATNDAPYWTSSLLVLPVAFLGNAYSNSLAANAVDPDTATTLTFTRLTGPSWLGISSSGAVTGVPMSDALGTNTWTVQVSDGQGSFAQTTLRITVSSTVIYEAELATLSGVSVATTYAGYSGTGYADYAHNSGDYVQWAVPLTASGNYAIAFRYALNTGSRPLQIRVNGQVVGTVAFPSTGAWTIWSNTLPINVMLDAGTNTVRATVTGSNGANVDYLALTSLLTNPPVAVMFTQVAFTNGTLTLTGTGPSGTSYRVWATTNITLPVNNWSAIATGTFTGGVFAFTDLQNTNLPGRFYRLSVP